GLAPGDEISSRDEKSPLPIDDPAGGALVGVLRQDERDRVDRVAIDVAASVICDVTRLGLALRFDLAAGSIEKGSNFLSRDEEPGPLRFPRDRRADADDSAGFVDERSAAVALVDRSAGLDHGRAARVALAGVEIPLAQDSSTAHCPGGEAPQRVAVVTR